MDFLANPHRPGLEEPRDRSRPPANDQATPARVDQVSTDGPLTEDLRGTPRRHRGSPADWTPWRRLGGILTSRPSVILTEDGRLEAFARGADRRMHHTWQIVPSGPWAGIWAAAPGGQASTGEPGQSIAVAGHDDGKLDVLAQPEVETAFAGPPVTARNPDGRLELFARDRGGIMHHIWEIAPDRWHDTWGVIGGGPVTSDAAVAVTGDGQLAIFACGPRRELVHAWQTSPSGRFTAWSSLGGSLDHASTPAVARNTRGELQVFVRWQDGSTRYRRLLPDSDALWADWQSLNGVARTDPVVVASADGRLAVFVVGADGALYVSEQTKPG